MAQTNESKSASKRRDSRRLALVAACFAVAVLAGAGVFFMNRSREVVIETDSEAVEEPVVEAEESEAETYVTVHVDGAVVNPGVYELADETPRVNDAVEAAGGVTGEADLTSVNLAATVSDGIKIHIPAYGEVIETTVTDTTTASGTADSGASSLININTATISELCELNGVGEATAQAIIDEREANGPFTSVEDLLRVSGIGEKKLAKIKDYVCV
jgi:competence protein ComEA